MEHTVAGFLALGATLTVVDGASAHERCGSQRSHHGRSGGDQMPSRPRRDACDTRRWAARAGWSTVVSTPEPEEGQMQDRARHHIVVSNRLSVAAAVLLIPAGFGSLGGLGAAGLEAQPPPVTEPTMAPVTAEITTPTAPAVDELDRLLVDFVGDLEGGVGVLSIRSGTTTTAVFGPANAAGDPIVADTAFRVGDLSKSFVATMVMQLVDEGRVDLDQPLSAYLPDTTVGGDVPIRMLLNHDSGLPTYTDLTAWFDDLIADRDRVFTPSEILSYVEDLPTGQPGQSFAFSDTNYILLGQLVEQLDDADLNTSLLARISEPLGLEVTHFATADRPDPDGLAAGWSPGVVDGDPNDSYVSIASSAWASFALISTTGELAAFLGGLFGGDLISDGALDEMTAIGPGGFGLGLNPYDPPSGGRMYGHIGVTFGYTSAMVIDPSTGDTLVVLSNNDALYAPELGVRIVEEWWLDQP